MIFKFILNNLVISFYFLVDLEIELVNIGNYFWVVKFRYDCILKLMFKGEKYYFDFFFEV